LLTEEKLNEMGLARLEHTLWKFLRCLAQETRLSKSSAQTVTLLLQLKTFKTTVVHEFQPCDPAKRANFGNWSHQLVHDELSPLLVLFPNKALFHIHGEVNSQNSRYWS
jgi:hypothetical protein